MNKSEKALLEQDFLSLIMSEGDLKTLGVGDVAYIKKYLIKGREVYVLHAADGSAVDVEENEAEVLKSANKYELNLVSLH